MVAATGRALDRRESTPTGSDHADVDAAGRTNLDIARSIAPRPIAEIAGALGLQDEEIQPFGRYVAKLDSRRVWERLAGRPNGRYVDVTGMTPTPLGEGKTLVTVGLSM